MLLLLPSAQSAFAQAAEAVRQGFFAAHGLGAQSIDVQVIEIDDDGEALARALVAAKSRGVRVVVGPLPRAAVSAVIEGRLAVLPMVTLNYAERDTAAPVSLIEVGLSVEAEAQRVARVALAELVGVRRVDARARLLVVSGPGPLDRRVAQAFVGALRAQGETPVTIELGAESAERVAAQLAAPNVEAVFLALNARDAAQLRARIAREVLVFGTSLLNAGDPRLAPAAAALAHDLEGVRFVDMPWLLQPDHPAVMIYRRDAQMPIELARLYALGIDAYRLALAWMNGETRFELDGVTGRLRVDRGLGPRVERVPAFAIYRNGAIEREELR